MLATIRNSSSIPLLLEKKFCVSIIDRHGIILYVNQLFCDLSKYSADELIGNHYHLLQPEKPSDIISELTSALQENKIAQRRMKRVAKDGSHYWIETTIMPTFDADDHITQFILFDSDITSELLIEERYNETLKDLHNIENALNQSTVVAITDRTGVITYVNDKFCQLSKYPAEELIGQTHRVVNSKFHPKSFFKEMWQTIGKGEIWTGDIKNRAKDGSEYWVSTTIVPFLDDHGKPFQYIAIRTDITDRKEAEHSLEIALKNDFRLTVKNLQNAIFKYVDDGKEGVRFTLVEGKMAQELSVTLEDIRQNRLDHPFSKTELLTYRQLLRRGLQGEAVHFELSFFQHTFLIYLSPIFEDGRVVEVVGTAIDITERKKAERLVERMAYYDFLTSLPNRRFFEQKVNEAINQARTMDETFAIMFIDLDRFKYINDSMGHAIGDKLLIAVGNRLRGLIRKEDVVGRHGGDEFVILLPSTQAAEAEKIAQRIIDSLADPFLCQDVDLFINSSIGISIFPRDGDDSDTLMRNADSAMFQAKGKKTNTYQFFTEALHDEIIEKSNLEMELRRAQQKNQFELYYQPQIDLKSGALTGLEALIRWHHPTRGVISPARFIPIAEETGLIVSIGQWVLETACLQAKQWQHSGLPTIQMSVNVSLHQFKQLSFVDQVEATLLKTGLHPSHLNLEITESMTSDVQNCKTTLQRLRELGVNVSIDDFGTGYSSLSYLSKFPITHLKIDQAFVQELSPSNRAIVKTIISLAKNLNLNVIAEGVETEEQADFLATLHCDEVQGYFYSKPLPKGQIESLLHRAL